MRNIIEEALVLDQLKSLDVVEFNPKLGNPVHSAKNLRKVFRDFYPEEFLKNIN